MSFYIFLVSPFFVYNNNNIHIYLKAGRGVGSILCLEGKGSFVWILIWMTWSKHRFFWWNQMVDLCSLFLVYFKVSQCLYVSEWVSNWHCFSFIDVNEYRDGFDVMKCWYFWLMCKIVEIRRTKKSHYTSKSMHLNGNVRLFRAKIDKNNKKLHLSQSFLIHYPRGCHLLNSSFSKNIEAFSVCSLSI